LFHKSSVRNDKDVTGMRGLQERLHLILPSLPRMLRDQNERSELRKTIMELRRRSYGESRFYNQVIQLTRLFVLFRMTRKQTRTEQADRLVGDDMDRHPLEQVLHLALVTKGLDKSRMHERIDILGGDTAGDIDAAKG